MKGLFFFISLVFACSSPGATCSSNNDCCWNPCSPATCMNGLCVESSCLGYGVQCGFDCQCCSGYCDSDIDNTPRCNVPTLAKPMDPPNACCGAGGDGWVCDICCPLGVEARCSLLGGCSCGTPENTLSIICKGSSSLLHCTGSMSTTFVAQELSVKSICHEHGNCTCECKPTTTSQLTGLSPLIVAVISCGSVFVFISLVMIVAFIIRRRKGGYLAIE